MPADASAYEALGVEPGADPATIERAYKKLIKEFHPDREGGDARRAAEINRAYRELRPLGRGAVELEEFDGGRSAGRRARLALWFAAAAVAIALAGRAAVGGFSASAPAPLQAAETAREGVGGPAEMDEPLATAEIDAAIRDAVQLARSADELALADASRECHRLVHQQPSLARLDRCAAFDNAVVQLQDRDPLRDRGPFSGLAVTGRQMSAATLLSNDYLAIDSRLDRIRLHVELALASREPDLASN